MASRTLVSAFPKWKLRQTQSQRINKLEEAMARFVDNLDAAQSRTDAAIAKLADQTAAVATELKQTAAIVSSVAHELKQSGKEIGNLAHETAAADAAITKLATTLHDYIGVESRINEVELTRATEYCFEEDGYKEHVS